MLLSRIPPEVSEGEDVPPGLQLTRPSIYFGSRPQLYAVLNEGEGVFLGPDGQPGEVGVDYPPGIQLESFLRTIVMAWRFRDANLLFASEISESSRFVFRRQVQERVRQVAPFLTYLEAPYPVVHEGRVVWMMEGFTSSRDLPLSSSHDSRTGQALNYIRNSVKITVDAVTGEMRFYTVIDDEPVLEAYRRAFPDLFRPLAEMPDGLLNHIRYPQSLLEVQGDVLRQYHQETARRFHGQQDVWTRPQELAQGSRSIPYSAQYAHYRLPGEEEAGFLLTTAFVPVGRQNLTGILAARSDPDRYGELLLLDVAVDDQVPGPRQVEALVEQDPLISEQFSLWRTGGSQVWTGHLHLIPVAGSLLYMEPVFLAADEDAIPELRRFILSDGRRVIMATSLEEALTILTEGPGAEGPQPMPSVTGTEPGAPAAPPVREWPDEALELLDSAEQRLRQGDWSGFGSNLDRLRSLLQGAETSSPVPEEGGAETVP